MNKVYIFILVAFIVTTGQSCKEEGCTDPLASNYSTDAGEEDGSCQYIRGCMDAASVSYNPLAVIDDGSCSYAGTGGSTTVFAKPQHHSVPIISKVGYPDSAFVKFNTQVFPGQNPALYDLVVTANDGDDFVKLENLSPGYYYILMTGFDSTVNMPVIGGLPFTLTQAQGAIDLIVPVTEH